MFFLCYFVNLSTIVDMLKGSYTKPRLVSLLSRQGLTEGSRSELVCFFCAHSGIQCLPACPCDSRCAMENWHGICVYLNVLSQETKPCTLTRDGLEHL